MDSLKNYIENVLSLPLPHLDPTGNNAWLAIEITSPLGQWSLHVLHEGIKFAAVLGINASHKDYGIFWGLIYRQLQVAYTG